MPPSWRVWHILFGHDQNHRLPWWFVPPVRFAYLVIQEFSRNRCFEKASALGFQTVFSLIPAFALALFMFRVYGDSSDLGSQVQRILLDLGLNVDKLYLKNTAVPVQLGPSGTNLLDSNGDGATQVLQPIAVEAEIQALVDNLYRKLATGGMNIVSFAWLVVAALALALTMDKTLNDIWGSAAQRKLLRRIAVYWSVLTLGPLFIGLSVYVTQQAKMNSFFPDLAVSAVGPLIALYLIYQLMPTAVVRPIPAAGGALVAALLWVLARFLFGLYVERYVGYGNLYGNLGLFPLFLFWVWVLWMIVLVGAEVAYTLQNLDRLAAEERRRHGAPFIQPGLVALGLVLHAGRAFAAGKGPVDADDLAESTGLPDQVWMRLVNLLQERGILVEVSPDGSRFLPGRPLDSLRVEEILTAVEESLVARPDEGFHPEQHQLEQLSSMLHDARKRQLGRTSIADLLATEAHPSGNGGERGLMSPDRVTPAGL